MMSGGHYNYFYFKMNEFAEEVEADSKDEAISPAMREKMQEFSREMVTAAIKAHDLEWFLSGDILEQEAYKTFTQKV